MTRYFNGKLKCFLLIIIVLFLALFFSQEQAVAVLNSTYLKHNVFIDLWRKLNSTENDLREVKDQVYDITRLYERGSEREGELKERAWNRCKISLFKEYVFDSTFLPSTLPSWKEAIALLNSMSLKQNVFLDLWRKLNSTENDLREVKDQVYNITKLYERGSWSEREGQRERERELRTGVKFPCSQNIVW